MRTFLVAAGSALALSASAQGGPPMLTDDPGTPPIGHWELNLVTTTVRTHDRLETGLPLIDLNYGALDNLQIKVEMPWVLAREGGESVHDLGPVLAGLKWRFQDEKGGRPAISTFPQVETASVRRSVDEGLAEAATGFLLPVEAAWHRGRHGLNVDAGLFLRSGEGPQWLGGGAVSAKTDESSELVAELHFEGEFAEGSNDCTAQLGYRHDLAESATFMVAVGRSLFTHGAPPTRFTSYVGFQFRF